MDTAFTANSPAPVVAPTRRPRRWWRIVLGVFACLIAATAGLYVYTVVTTRTAWAEAEAEAALDTPRWRLMELDADRPAIPDEENSALHMIATRRKAGGFSVGMAPNYEAIFEKLTPIAQLNRQQSELIRGELAKIVKPLEEARKLKDMPRGRFPVVYTDDFIGTLLPEHQNARTIAEWLQHDAMLLAHDEEYDKAVESCLALLTASRAFDGDPFLISHLIRVAMQTIAIVSLERVLAQGQASEPTLQAMQSALERETKESGWLAAVRGERAGFHHLFDNIRQGKVEAAWLGKMGIRTGANSLEGVGMWIADRYPSMLLKYYPELLQHMNRTVEAAKLPEHERTAEMKKLDKQIQASRNPVLRQLAPAIRKVSDAELRSQAMLRATLVAVACERYRLRHRDNKNENAWPATLDDLVKAKLLDAIPLDPFDGQPIRFLRTKTGIVVYSVGFDLVDNKGNIDRAHWLDPGFDLGFRLWNVEQRRQPPLPPVALPAAER